MGKCKTLDKCKKCRCCDKNRSQGGSLSEKMAVPRPVERVVERQIVELATRCEPCCHQITEGDSA